MDYYRPKYFKLYELVPPEVYESTPHYKIWWCWNPKVLWTADALREIYGPAVINNWYWGGNLKYRGWRPKVPPPGQRWSEWTQHAWFNALDMSFADVDVGYVRQDILDRKYPKSFQYIKCIEEDVSWLHFDCRNHKGPILII